MRGLWRIKVLANRLKRRWREMVFRPYVIRRRIEGMEFDFLIGDVEAQSWYDTPREDWLEMRFIRDFCLSRGDTVVECGGHHGCSSILMSRWVGKEGKVITFEPNPRNAAILRKNIAINKIDNVEVVEKAMGSLTGRIEMTDESNSTVGSVGNRGKWVVDVATLDTFAELAPSLVKIDVEGYECQVLEGGRILLANTPALAIEVHAGYMQTFGGSVDRLFSAIPGSVYNFHVQWNDAVMPVPYDRTKKIEDRTHLFALPKEKKRKWRHVVS